MELMFEIISRQKFAARSDVSYIFGKAGGYIGRSDECEWVLPDKSKQISRKHALISCDGENFYIEDLSTNGILTVVDKQPLPKGARLPIEHGTSYYLGEYTIQARLIHKPDAYISSADAVAGTDLIPDDAYLDLDPLVAMEQQEEFEARRRMGLYNDLLGATSAPQALQDDHNAPPMDCMPEVRAIPENWNPLKDQPVAGISPQNGQTAAHQPFSHSSQRNMPPVQMSNAAGFGNTPYPATAWRPQPEVTVASLPPAALAVPVTPRSSVTGVPVPVAAAHPVHNEYTILYASPGQREVETEIQKVPETDVFFKTLGFTEPPTEPAERERILKEAAEMLLAAVDGLLQSLRNRADSKNDLRLPVTTMTLAGNNPLKYSPNALVALEHMLAPRQDGTLPPGQAIVSSFCDIHSHHMGILAGARAAVNAALHKISPEKVESKLDADAPRRFNKSGKLWKTYTRMHRMITGDPEGFSDFFLHDFARAYELQVRTLHPIPGRNKGE